MRELGNRPLLATARDQRLAVPRPEVERVNELARRGLNVLLTGERGAGKTTALHAVAARLRGDGGRVELVDAGPAEDVPALTGRLAAVLAAPREEIDLARVVRDALRETDRSPTTVAIDTIRSWRGLDGPVHLLLDELRPELAHPLFGRLRDELWQTPVRFVVTAPAHALPDFVRPPADAFFEATVRLGPLPPEAQRELLRRRLDDDELARVVPALGGADLGTPRELLAAARAALMDGAAAGAIAAGARERARRVAGLGPAAERLLAELDALGGASASDPGLLERLGWSRQRAAQVARSLEEAGLVRSGAARGDDRRVRRMFVPVPAVDLSPERAPATDGGA